MRQLEPRDSAYVYLGEHHLASTVLSCWVLARPDGGPCGLEASAVAATLLERMAADEIFSSVLLRLPGDVGHPYWVRRPDLDLTEHIRFHEPSGRTWPGAQEMLARIAATPFDVGRPLWNVDVITDISGMPAQTGLATVVAISFHHAAFDGVSWERTMHQLLTDTPGDRPAVTPAPIGVRDRTTARLVGHEIRRAPAIWITFLVNLVRMVVVGAAGVRAAKSATAGREKAPTTRFNTGLHGRRWTDYVEFSLDDAKAIKNMVDGATVNDVLLSIVGGTMADYLTGHDEAPDESMTALVPMSIRSEGSASSANQFVPLVIDMHTTEPDLLARIAEIAKSSAAEKARGAGTSSGEYWRLINSVPAALLRLAGYVARRRERRTIPSAKVNTAFSSVINHTPITSMLGVPTVSGFGFAPLGTWSTISHFVVSGLGRLMIVVTADDEVVPDTAHYAATLQATVDAHRALIPETTDRSA